MPYYVDSHGNVDHASPALLKPGELESRGLRLITDAEAKRRLAKGQPVRLPVERATLDDGENDGSPIDGETSDDVPDADEGPDLGAAAQAQFDELVAEIDNQATDKDRLEAIGRDYDIELDKRKSLGHLRTTLKAKIAETLGLAI